MDVQLPNLPDVAGMDDTQLRDFLVAVKQTLEILTGTDVNSNGAVVDLINDNQ
jgi:hypothetical protein